MEVIRIVLTASALLFTTSVLPGQCGTTVDAGPDRIVCPGQGPITLNGTVSANAFGYAWEADPTLSDPRSLNPEVNPTGTTDYVLIAYTADPADNLVVNGDFEAGNTGFTSQYDFEPGGNSGPITPDGSYSITNNSNAAHSLFNACSDNSGSGNMMACNGSTQTNLKVWCQTVSIDPSTTYVLRAYIASIWNVGAAELQFSVNDDLVGPVFRPTLTPPCTYDFFDERWTSSAGETTAEICVVNQTTIFFGYNFSLDDIFFAPVCEQYDTVRVELVDTEVSVDNSYDIPCGQDPTGLAITAVGATDAGYTYEWTTANGSIVSGENDPTVFVDAAGFYTVTLSFTDGISTCSDSRTVNVTMNDFPPDLFLESDGDFNCVRDIVTLTSNNSFIAPGSTFSWSTADGSIISNPSGDFIRVDAVGTYELTVFTGACTDTETFIVGEDLRTPTALIGPTSDLSCDSTSVTLNAGGTVVGPDDTFFWTTDDGEFSGSTNTLTPTVVTAGTYVLFVQNLVTGCFDEARVQIGGSGERPVATIAAPPRINCQGDAVLLSSAGSTTNGAPTYAWTTTNGQLQGATDGPTARAVAPGDYELLITAANGCTARATVTVEQEGFNPDISFLPVRTITCDRNQVAISSEVTTTESVTYEWTTTDGTIVSGGTSLNPMVAAGGTYRLIVTEPGEGCSVSAVVSVAEDRTPPLAVTADTAIINCLEATVELTATGSSTGPDISLSWLDETGSPVSGPVATSGFYELTVVNGENGCLASDTLTVLVDTLSPVVALVTDATSLSCIRDSVLLTETGNVPGVGYRWSGPEGEEMAAAVTVGTPGTYLLTAVNNSNGCSTADSVTISEDRELPVIGVEPALPLTCDRTQVELSGSVANPDGFDLSWSTTGNIVSGSNSLTPTVDVAGDYQLTLLNAATGCTDSLTITVGSNTTLPSATIALADTLTCQEQTVRLDGSASTAGDSIGYTWSAVTGTISGSATGTTVDVVAAGSYRLTVRNDNTGCSSEATITVAENSNYPSVDLPEVLTLSCLRASLPLNEGAVAEDGLRYAWSRAENATPLSDLPTLTVTEADRYTLSVENTSNGCLSSDSVLVETDTIAPVATIAPAGELNCTITELLLRESGSSLPGATYTWTTTDGNYAQNDATAESRVDAGGTYALRIRNPNGCVDSTTITVGIDTLRPAIDLPTEDSLNCRTPERTIVATVANDQGAAINYLWSYSEGPIGGLATTPSISVDRAGVYTLLVRNETNTCERSAEITVAVDTLRPVVADLPESATLTCLLPTITLNEGTATESGLTYTWVNTVEASTVSSLPEVTVTTAGRYTLTVENTGNGCSSSDSVKVSIDTLSPVAIIAPVEILNCTVTELDLLASGTALPAASYEWTTGDGNFVINDATINSTINAAGTYALRIRNPNGCTDSTAVTVGIDTLRPTIMLPVVAALDCRDTERSILAEVADIPATGTRYDWSWSDGTITGPATSPSITVDRAGVYTLRVTNGINTCERSASLTVGIDTLRPLLAALRTDTIDCVVTETRPNPTIVSGRPAVDYDWTTLSGPAIASATASPLVTAGGTFELRVTDPVNGCSSSRGWAVVQDTVAPVLRLPDALDLGCDTLPVTITVQADAADAYTFNWSTVAGTILSGQTTATVELMGPAVYTVAAENGRNGCRTLRDITLTQTLLDGFTFELRAPDCSLETGVVNFGPVAGGIPPFVYSIDGGQSYTPAGEFAGLSPDNYDLRVQDVRGCEVSLPATVPPVRYLEIGLTDNFSLLQGDSLQLNLVMNFTPAEIDTILWTGGAGLSCYDCPRPTARPFSSTTYDVEVISLDGCRARTQVQALVDEREAVYVPNAFSPNGDGVNDLLSPLAAVHRVNGIRKFEIFDRWGNQVYLAEQLPVDGSGGGWDGTFRGRALPVGAYVWWAEVELTDGRPVLLKGDVTILR